MFVAEAVVAVRCPVSFNGKDLFRFALRAKAWANTISVGGMKTMFVLFAVLWTRLFHQLCHEGFSVNG
jgi:hypothetical protein